MKLCFSKKLSERWLISNHGRIRSSCRVLAINEWVSQPSRSCTTNSIQELCNVHVLSIMLIASVFSNYLLFHCINYPDNWHGGKRVVILLLTQEYESGRISEMGTLQLESYRYWYSPRKPCYSWYGNNSGEDVLLRHGDMWVIELSSVSTAADIATWMWPLCTDTGTWV